MLTCKQHRIVHHEEITRGNGHRETTGKIWQQSKKNRCSTIQEYFTQECYSRVTCKICMLRILPFQKINIKNTPIVF
jgi:hypothetical protein